MRERFNFKGYYLWAIPTEERDTVREWLDLYSKLYKEVVDNNDTSFEYRLNKLEAILFKGFRIDDRIIPSIYSVFPLPREFELREAAIQILLMRIRLAKKYLKSTIKKRS